MEGIIYMRYTIERKIKINDKMKYENLYLKMKYKIERQKVKFYI